MRSLIAGGLLVFALVATARAAEPMTAPELGGRWIAATSDRRMFAGTWTAEVKTASPNAAVGTWKLIDETGTKVLMRGTWSANKGPAGWRGSWAARIEGGGGATGTWKADANVAGAKTFTELLALTRDKEIGGKWRAGRAHGDWSLKPPR